MKLLLYSHFFAPSIGGVENVVLSLADGLSRLQTPQGACQFNLTVVTQTPAGGHNDAAYPFCVLRRPGFLQLWRAIRNADVLHVAGPAFLPLLLGFLLRKPVVIEHHGYQAICPNGLLVHQPDGAVCPGHFQAQQYQECWRCLGSEHSAGRTCLALLLTFPRRWLSQKAAANLAVSQHVMERHGLPHSTVIYHGIAGPPKQGPVAPLEPTRVCFAYVGRFVSEKGVAILLRAAAILREQGHDFEVRLIGDGPQRPELVALTHKNGLDSCVRITGFLTGASLEEALRSVHVAVLPSVCEETAGLTAIEQMMQGRLLIASKIGGLTEIVGDAGLLFPAGDAQALAEAMLSVLENPSLAQSTGRKARDRALCLFRRERMIEDHARVYRNLLPATGH